MTITEPTALITDYVLAVVSTVFAISLLRARTHRGTLLWGVGFLVLAGAGLTGGSFHGFQLMMSNSAHRGLWNVTMVLIGASAGFMISGALSSSMPWKGRNTQWHTAGLFLSIVGFAIQQSPIAIDPNFNHNDLFHCVQIVALYFFFRGAKIAA
jgi:hypothetical protein